ncbi:MAG: hypothetical protein N3G20_11370, partial [Verrucomicrobiae bacterium]|nr:hypothetical protein [Verrucomicrobiae bacterium]
QCPCTLTRQRPPFTASCNVCWFGQSGVLHFKVVGLLDIARRTFHLGCMKRAGVLLFLGLSFLQNAICSQYSDRFVWIFGWNLSNDSDVTEICNLIETGAKHGINGAMVSFGLDTLCKKTPEFFRRLEAIKAACGRNRMELIPAIFSVGYGGGILGHDRNLAEGLPVENAVFAVENGEARIVPDESVRVLNGGFEEFNGNRMKSYSFHDQPGEVSFADTEVKHGGQASLRLENFTSNAHGHGRVMQEIRVKPHRIYRVTLWAKTDGLEPTGAFQIAVLAGSRSLAPRTFSLPSTTDWQKLTMLFNSLTYDVVRLYAGVWGGRSGRLWLDDWSIEEVGPLNVLRRPGTPVTVRSEDGSTTYNEGSDYAPLVDPEYNPYRVDRPSPVLKIPPNSRIRDGQRLLVSWYHPLLIHESQITVCMGEPALHEIFDHEAKLLAERLQPRKVMLNMDEVRMGGTCRACTGRNMGELLGECITRQVNTLRKYIPQIEVYVWSDMLDPNHNAHGDYYLVQGDFTGSWKHVPKDVIVAVWGGEPRESSLRFFADEGFKTLVACYYDADDLNDVKRWVELAEGFPNVRGFMYTPWQKKYGLLSAFGDLCSKARPVKSGPKMP